MKQLSRQDIRQRLLDILLNFYDFCHQNGLNPYLCAGTLLGAVRHGGFIPWDDDIDTCLDRVSYEKLMRIAKKNDTFNGHYKIVDFRFENSSYPFIKIVDLETKMSQEFENDEADYLWIDVFPMDGLPADVNKQKRLYRRVTFVREVQMLSFAKANGRTFVKKLIKPLIIPLAKIYGLKRANQRLNKLAQTYDYRQTGWIGDVLWGEFGKETLSVKEYFQSTTMSFEGHKFETMACWDKYLTMLYGIDYMAIPPKSKRVDHRLTAWLR